MTTPRRTRRLSKELSLLDVYVVATGTTLSGGFFLLPGLAAVHAGPALIVAYLIAVVPLVPAIFSVLELATAMPRAGGVYYFIDRSLGPLVGAIGGFGTWLALSLKVAFALVGMGAYLGLFLPGLPIVPVGLGLATVLGVIGLYGAKLSTGVQTMLVTALLAVLTVFVCGGLPAMEPAHFRGFFDAGTGAILSTAGLVYVSYVGVTKVAALAEEVQNPERNLPLGVFLALGTAILVYGLGTTVIVGLLPPADLAGDLTPVASAAARLAGGPGLLVVSIAAMIAFTSVANAGMLSASRYPLAMSRDRLLPPLFGRVGRGGSPTWAVVLTAGLVMVIVGGLDATRIAKLASGFQLAMFALVSLAVIVMRESQIDAYDPGYRSPGYPWMQLAGIVAALVLIGEMGREEVLLCTALVVASAAWYLVYARARIDRGGAIFHVFERLGRQRFAGLDPELRSILKEKGLREADPFEEIVARAGVIDAGPDLDFERIVHEAASCLAAQTGRSADELEAGFLKGTLIGATPVDGGVALPHLRLPQVNVPELVLARTPHGLRIAVGSPLGETRTAGPVFALFFLVSPEADPARHLRLLAQIAGRVDEEDFHPSWSAATDPHALKEVLLRHERYVSLVVAAGTPTASLIGRPLRDTRFPENCLVAIVRRGPDDIVPTGTTVLEAHDRLTVIGTPAGIRWLRQHYQVE